MTQRVENEKEKPFSIAFVADPRLAREKQHIVMRSINTLRHSAEVVTFSGDTTEGDLLEKLEKRHFDLVLAPWYRYLAWSKIEGHYGLSRTTGPTFAGYFGDQVLPYELGDQPDHLRVILIDLSRLATAESVIILKSLLQETQRSGLRPLLAPQTPLYCESWTAGHGIGFRLDAIGALEPGSRLNSLRICFTALWSLVFDEGPGRNDARDDLQAHQPQTPAQPRAWFQLGTDSQALAMRVCYSQPRANPKDILKRFRPDPAAPSSPAQLLLRHSDLLRVHLDPETGEVEIVAALFPSAPSEKAVTDIHTLWIEPLSASLVIEKPFAALTPENPLLKPFVTHHQLISEAAAKMGELRRNLVERDDLIRELKSGGVGSKVPLAPPEAEALLEAFQERYFESRHRIRQFQIQLARMTQDKAKPAEIAKIHREMTELARRQTNWIAKLSETLEGLRAAKATQNSS